MTQVPQVGDIVQLVINNVRTAPATVTAVVDESTGAINVQMLQTAYGRPAKRLNVLPGVNAGQYIAVANVATVVAAAQQAAVQAAIPGPAGPKGDTGLQGLKGDPGVQGDPGPAGPQGDRGLQGLPGAPGQQGLPGQTGSQGLQGIPGPTGAIGSQGAPGNAGQTGPKGDTGPQGVKGDPGATGAQGVPGTSGILTASVDAAATVFAVLWATQATSVAIAGVTTGMTCLATYADGNAIEPGAQLTARCSTAGTVIVERRAAIANLTLAKRTVNIRVIP